MTTLSSPQDAIVQITNALLQPHNLRLKSYKILQNLWAGYGKICHVEALSIAPQGLEKKHSFILKHVTPPPTSNNSVQDEGHLRKLISYQVEQYFYSHLAPSLPEDIAVAQCIGSVKSPVTAGQDTATITLLLRDLRERFPVAGEKRGDLDERTVFAALKWLAAFHGFWSLRTEQLRRGGLRLPPLEEAKRMPQSMEGLWLNGGYTYLATRRKEYAALREDVSSEWSSALCQPVTGSDQSIAELVARVLAPSKSADMDPAISRFETLIHGDVKSENLFADPSGATVAFFDFQYVGLGFGVCDLAKLFTCSIPLDMLLEHGLEGTAEEALAMSLSERGLLEYYTSTMHDASGKEYPWEDFEMHWNTALVDWLRFQASWGFWGNTEWLESRVRHILRDVNWRMWLLKTAEQQQTGE